MRSSILFFAFLSGGMALVPLGVLFAIVIPGFQVAQGFMSDPPLHTHHPAWSSQKCDAFYRLNLKQWPQPADSDPNIHLLGSPGRCKFQGCEASVRHDAK